MKLIIDYRENKLISSLQIPFTTENLPIGDILFEDEHFRLLVERKTSEDMTSSIKDGRFREQRSRLLSWRSDHNKIIYLIEGSIEQEKRTVHRLMIAYDFPIWKTGDLEETRKYIEWIYQMGLAHFFKKRDPEKDQIENMRFSERQSKNKILTPKNLLISTLSSIHGVSYEMAKSISTPFANLQEFMDKFNPEEEYYYTTCNRTEKKIGKTILLRIEKIFK